MFKALSNPNRVYTLSLLALIVTAFFSVGYHHFDEHFQILEFAGAKLGINQPENLPWEYREQMRPTIQPLLTVWSYKIYSFLGLSSPFVFTWLLRLLSAILGFYALKRVWKYLKVIDGVRVNKTNLLLMFMLFPVVYNAVRFSSENWSGILFALGFTSYFLEKDQFKKILFTGLGLGFAFLFRYQVGFMIFGFALWLLFIQKESFKQLLFLGLIILSCIGLGVLLDRLYYGEWTWSVYNYFEQNILNDRVSGFGVYPWWWYLSEAFIRLIPPFSLLFLVGFGYLLIKKHKHPVLWVIFPFLIIHFIIGHKEVRFLFSMLYFLPFVGMMGVEFFKSIIEKYQLKKAYYSWLNYLFFTVYGLMLIIIMFKPADPTISLYSKLYHSTNKPATLYFVNENPYHRVLDIYFYKRQNLTVKKLDSWDELTINQDEAVFLAYTNKDNVENELEGEVIYTSFPSWIKVFNIGGWQDRTKQWEVIKIR